MTITNIRINKAGSRREFCDTVVALKKTGDGGNFSRLASDACKLMGLEDGARGEMGKTGKRRIGQEIEIQERLAKLYEKMIKLLGRAEKKVESAQMLIGLAKIQGALVKLYDLEGKHKMADDALCKRSQAFSDAAKLYGETGKPLAASEAYLCAATALFALARRVDGGGNMVDKIPDYTAFHKKKKPNHAY